MSRICYSCGHEMPDGAITCNLCGDEIAELRVDSTFEIDRHRYLGAMAENLPLLRNRLGVTQTELANIIGVSRQTIATAETGAREMSWSTFISLLFVFRHNMPTNALLPVLGIFTTELSDMFNLSEYGRSNDNT